MGSSVPASRRPKFPAKIQGFWERQEETGLEILPCEMQIVGDKMIGYDGTTEGLKLHGEKLALAGLTLTLGVDDRLNCQAPSGALIRYQRSVIAKRHAVGEFQGEWLRMHGGLQNDEADLERRLTIDGICWTYTGTSTRKGCLKQSDDGKSVLLGGCRVVKLRDASLGLVPPSGDVLHFGRDMKTAAAIFSDRLGAGPGRPKRVVV